MRYYTHFIAKFAQILHLFNSTVSKVSLFVLSNSFARFVVPMARLKSVRMLRVNVCVSFNNERPKAYSK
jgi:hypothetical protein